MTKDTNPIRATVRCALCEIETPHDVRASASSVQEDSFEFQGRQHSVQNYLDAQVSECVVCQNLVMVRRAVFSETHEDEDVRVYPSAAPRRAPAWRTRLPDEPERLMKEVYGAWAMGYRSVAAMGARTLIDYVIRRRVRKRCGFAEGVKALVSKGLLAEKTAKYVERAIESGHAAVHRGHCPNDEQLSSLMEIVEHLLQSVLMLDAEARKLSEATPRRSRRRKKSASKPKKKGKPGHP